MMVSKEPIPEQHRRAVAARTSTDPAEASEAPIPKITMLPRSANNTASYWPAAFGVTQATARNRQSTGSFPPADKIGRERLYRIDEVDAWRRSPATSCASSCLAGQLEIFIDQRFAKYDLQFLESTLDGGASTIAVRLAKYKEVKPKTLAFWVDS